MADPGQKRILIIGNSQTREMSPVLEAVSESCGGISVLHALRPAMISTERVFPELIIVCQNWPDEFSASDLNDLVSRFPVSRFVCCYGAWCEADGRTRTVWPLSIRVPARSVRVRIQQEWEIIQGTAKAFPLTAGREEIFQFEASDKSFKLDFEGAAPLIGVCSGDRDYQAMLNEMMVSWGARVTHNSKLDEADLLIFDLDPWELVVQQLSAITGSSPMIGMMGLAHPEMVSAARLRGLETVICKVAPERELFQAVERILKLKAFPQGVC
tara:strand:+ start:1334 stop:2143 length:810 start_codon:yes stop_codon:yes gene_type:complete